MASILERIAEVRGELENLVISISRPSGYPWYDCAERWEELAVNLGRSLGDAECDNEELRKTLYARSLSWLGVKTITESPAIQQTPAIPEVPQKVQMAIDFIKAKGPVKGLAVANHIGVAYTGFRTHYVRKLKTLGVRNDGDGYYFPAV